LASETLSGQLVQPPSLSPDANDGNEKCAGKEPHGRAREHNNYHDGTEYCDNQQNPWPMHGALFQVIPEYENR